MSLLTRLILRMGFGLIVAGAVLNEEQFLRRELPGYSKYCLHTRSRLVPDVW